MQPADDEPEPVRQQISVAQPRRSDGDGEERHLVRRDRGALAASTPAPPPADAKSTRSRSCRASSSTADRCRGRRRARTGCSRARDERSTCYRSVHALEYARRIWLVRRRARRCRHGRLLRLGPRLQGGHAALQVELSGTRQLRRHHQRRSRSSPNASIDETSRTCPTHEPKLSSTSRRGHVSRTATQGKSRRAPCWCARWAAPRRCLAKHAPPSTSTRPAATGGRAGHPLGDTGRRAARSTDRDNRRQSRVRNN